MDSIRNIVSWRKNLLKSRLSRNITMAVSSTALAQGITIAISPLLTRLYTTTDLGIFAVYNSTLIILSVLTSLRYELTVPLPKEDSEAANLLTLSMILLPITAAIVACFIPFTEESIIHLTDEPGLRPFLSWLAPGLIVVGAYQALSYWFLRRLDFGPIASSKSIQSLIQGTIHILLGIFVGGAIGLLAGLLLGYLIGSLWFIFLILKKDRLMLKSVNPQKIWSLALKYKHFPLISSGSAILNNIGIQLPVYIFTVFFDARVVGLFALTQRVINVPISILSGSIGQVFTSEAAHLATESPQALLSLFNQMTKRLFFLSLIPATIFALIGPPLFALVFGEEWREAGTYASLLMPLIIARFVVSPAGQVFNVLELLNFQLVWDTVRFVVLAATLVLVARKGDAVFTIGAYSITLTVLYSALYLVYRRVIFKLSVTDG